ncbi:M28 family metallopeptidase [Nocardioides sp. Soil805]|uniref:M28 family metallopeptidase n=1 Tax=Nocardioides sp. Soil805 TaxID=1736416 RepID=UPI00070291E6|nr:M28 family metallopeptidase [Nocardioides sp. Soil805]KRF34886.1 hydrolase [Nocardioides sp. Soil805]
MPRIILAPVAALAALAAGLLVPGGSQAAPAPAAPVTTASALAAPDISVTNTQAHLAQLQAIADANGGNRATGRPGYLASVNWVRGTLDAAGWTTTVQQFSTSSGTSYNLVADWPGGDPEHVVMLGGHLDSVSSGPGINDNGTGSAGLLENALAFAASGTVPKNHVRLGFWGAEEQGLLGSKHYMATLPTADKDRIELYLNFDMIGSPNPGYFVYDDNPAGDAARDDLTAYFTSRGIPWEYIDVQGRSDHAAFRSYGIPTSGTFTGAETTMTSAQASKWGGQAGRAFDPCYHASCDTTANVDTTALDRNIDAIAHMLWSYAAKDYGPSLPPAGNLLANPGFESGATGWGGSTGVITSSTSRPAHGGFWKAWLGGNGRTSTETLTQQVTIPATATSASLSYWVRTDTAETGSTAYDRLKVNVVDGATTTTLKTFSNAGATATWGQSTHSLLAYRGRTVTVSFVMTEDASLQTSFVVDDTAVTVG